MEDIITYIFIFGLIIIFTWFYLGKRENKKSFSLGKKYYAYVDIDVIIVKKSSQIEKILIRLSPFPGINLKSEDLIMESVEPNGTGIIKKIEVFEALGKDLSINNNEFHIGFPALKQYLMAENLDKNNFRFVVKLNSTKNLKTVLLALNKKWSVYVPDTGRYN